MLLFLIFGEGLLWSAQGIAGVQYEYERENVKTETSAVRMDALKMNLTGTGVFLGTEPGETLPQRWYAGDHGKKPVVRSQGKYGMCWALTAASAMESVLLPEKQLVFSAEHLVQGSSFTMDMRDGGSYYMTMAYLCGWQGPVLESEDPYGDEYSPEGLQAAVHVQEMQILDHADVAQIKAAVYQYGAVQTSLYMSRATTSADKPYYNEVTSSYYYPEERTQDHDVLILGWDDNWSRFQFKQIPEHNGAFICQNTWGSGFGRDGIFYVSYEDANIGCSSTVYSRIDQTDNYDHIYQNDPCGWQGRLGYGGSTGWFANVYRTEAEEQLEAVGFYATGKDALYEVYLTHDVTAESDLNRRTLLASGQLKQIGYYTIDLEKPQILHAGESYGVIVRMKTPGTNDPIAVEFAADKFTQNVTLEGKQGYISQFGNDWQSTEDSFRANVCLKTYTNDR